MTPELETRTCTTKNCKRTFRVLTTSKQTVCSNSCAQGPYPEASKAAASKGEPVETEETETNEASPE